VEINYPFGNGSRMWYIKNFKLFITRGSFKIYKRNDSQLLYSTNCYDCFVYKLNEFNILDKYNSKVEEFILQNI
jgi:hypothetical protein